MQGRQQIEQQTQKLKKQTIIDKRKQSPKKYRDILFLFFPVVERFPIFK